MSIITWDRFGDRVYESGLDRGVLYLPDGSAVPWNGLTSIIEEFDKTSSPTYFDGMKINDLVTLGDFSASMKAVTYPEEFSEIEGLGPSRRGLFFGDQPPQVFGLCYRTQVGNDLDGDQAGYKIHILYNVTAIPRQKTYATITPEPTLVEFEWDITAVPEEFPGFRPTAHIIIDSREFDPWLLEELEEMLYGSNTALAVLIPMPELVSYISEWYRIKIIDNEDGTWTAISARPEFIEFDLFDEDLITIIGANAVYLEEDLYEISDTFDIGDVPQIKIIDNGDGTWVAISGHDNLILVDVDFMFEIRNANAFFLGPDTYSVSDTTDS